MRLRGGEGTGDHDERAQRSSNAPPQVSAGVPVGRRTWARACRGHGRVGHAAVMGRSGQQWRADGRAIACDALHPVRHLAPHLLLLPLLALGQLGRAEWAPGMASDCKKNQSGCVRQLWTRYQENIAFALHGVWHTRQATVTGVRQPDSAHRAEPGLWVVAGHGDRHTSGGAAPRRAAPRRGSPKRAWRRA